MNFSPRSWLKNTDLYKYLAAIPIPAFIVLIAALIPFDNRAVFEPPWLLPVLNTVFIFAIYFAVAYISAKSYLASGSLSIFLLGCGMLVFGSAALLGGWLIAAPGGINVNVTLVNIGALFGSIFHLMGAMLTSMRVNPELNSKRRKRNLTLAYSGVLLLIILLTIASFQGITPPFFIQGIGPTLLRQVVLGIAAMLFAISALLFMRLYFQLKKIYLYWYALALMLVAVDLFAAFLQHAVGSPIGWAGRSALYLGGIYFLNAIFIAKRTASTRGISIEEAVANFFREPEENFRVLVETANDAIVSFDNEGRVLLWNSAAEKIFGYNRSEAVGSILGDLIIPDSYADAIKKEMENLTATGKSTQIGITIEMEAKRKDGKVFPVEFSVSARRTSDEWMYTSIIRDITERKRAEEALRKANDELELRVRERTAELAKSNEALQAEIAERKQTEEALRESEERFRVALMNAPTSVMRHDKDLRYIWIYNPIKGSRPEDYIGKRDDEILPHEQVAELVAFKRYVLESGIPTRREIGFTLGGQILYYDVYAEPVRAPYGEIVGLTVTATDINERKRAEKEMRRAKELSDALNNINTAINSILDFDEIIRRVIVESAKAIGCETASIILREGDYWVVRYIYGLPEELIGTRFTDKDLPRGALATRTKQLVVINDAYNDNRVNREVMERYGVRSVLVISLVVREKVIGNIYFNYHSAPTAFAPAQVDFARKLAASTSLAIQNARLFEERKHAEEKVREQADLLDKAQDAIIVQDLEHRITYWNKSAVSIYGWIPEEAIGKNADELIYKEGPPQLIEAKKSIIENDEWMGELRQRTKEGKEIIVESHWTLVRDNEGKPRSILIINTDITEKKKLESHLLRAQRMESIGILAGGIAHNLNNMLTPMMMSLQMLKGKFTDEQSQKLLNILEKNSQRSADLIKQVLSFSRGIEGERTPLQAKYIITEIEKIAKETFPRNIELRTDIQKDLFTISGDVTQLHQVIMNLCVNARDAMPDGGILSISAENFFIDENYARMHTEAKVGSYVTIAVSDTGIGIPHKILDRIFEPFFTTKEFGKGTGLGLSTALAIVKSHGGFINVESKVGEGTMFRVCLPAIKTELQNVEEQQLELFTGHGELVLVAEDEDSVREVTISTLGTYGYEVLAANDGAQAVAVYAENMDAIKVILMDMMMPVMDGQASIQAIRKINPGVKIIAVSGLAEKEKLKNVADTTNAFLPKPYTAERLLKTVNEVLNIK